MEHGQIEMKLHRQRRWDQKPQFLFCCEMTGQDFYNEIEWDAGLNPPNNHGIVLANCNLLCGL